MKINNILPNQHAFIVHLNGRVADEITVDSLEKSLTSSFNNEMLTMHRYLEDSFTVKLARAVKAAQENKNRPHERRIIMVGFSSITNEAQNALLKVLEEPSERTHLFLIVPHPHALLPTVRSRCITIEAVNEEATLDSNERFLTKSYKDRLNTVAKLLDNKSNVPAFFSSLEKEIASAPKEKRAQLASRYPQLVDYKRHALTGTQATKYLLEEIALTLPTL